MPQYPQPFDNRPTLYTYIPRFDSGGGGSGGGGGGGGGRAGVELPFSAPITFAGYSGTYSYGQYYYPSSPWAPAPVSPAGYYPYQGGYDYSGYAGHHGQHGHHGRHGHHGHHGHSHSGPPGYPGHHGYSGYPGYSGRYEHQYPYGGAPYQGGDFHPATIGNLTVGRTRGEVQAMDRSLAARSGAYDAHPIKPANAKPGDMFWCRETDGQWHLRPFYNIDSDCKPGSWKMDAHKGTLVYHRE